MSYGVDPSQHHAVPSGPDLSKTPLPPFGQAPAPEHVPAGGYGQAPPYGQAPGYDQPGYGQPGYGQPPGAAPVPFGAPVAGMAPPPGYDAAPGQHDAGQYGPGQQGPGQNGWSGQAPLGSPAGDVTLKPSLAQYRKFVGSGPIAALALLAFLYFRHGSVALVVGIVAVVLALGGTLLYIQRTELRMDAVSVRHRHLFGTRQFARADVAESVLAPFQASAQDRRLLLTLLLRDRGGRKLLRLASSMWDPADLERLAYSFGVTPRVHDELLTPKSLEAHHPGSTSWVERHPVLLALLIVVAVIALIAVGVVALG